MTGRGIARTGVITLALMIAGGVSTGFAQAMKVAAQSIPIPSDDKPHELTEVRYGASWTVDFRSIRLEIGSQADADKVEASWTVTGVNSRSRPTRAQLSVILLDADGKAVATAKKSLMVRPGGEPYEYEIKMKVKQRDWQRAERVKLQANFFIAS
jgi:hypothetical protein